MSKVVDIRVLKMEAAGKKLSPVLAEIWEEHGLELSLTLLMYYAGKGIQLSEDLTAEEKAKLAANCWKDFNKSLYLHKRKS